MFPHGINWWPDSGVLGDLFFFLVAVGHIMCTLHRVQRCSLLLQRVVWSVCLMLDTIFSCVRMAKPVEMLFGLWTSVGPRNRVLGSASDPPGSVWGGGQSPGPV